MPSKNSSSSSTHDLSLTKFEFEMVLIAVSAVFVDYSSIEVVESFDKA